MAVYFISDLHLSENRPELTDLFLRFIKGQAQQAQAVYILGDFFDFWIGDDEDSELIRAVKQALSGLSAKGVKLYFQHGNRDFLIGKHFAQECGMVLLPEYYTVDLYGKKILMCHGDTLCIDDTGYQRFRKIVHLKWLQKLFLLLPLRKRIAIGENIRRKSKSGKQYKAAEIMDVNTAFTDKTVQQYGADILIHGHTHRQNIHQHQNFTRIVLGDWHDDRWSLLSVDEHGFAFE